MIRSVLDFLMGPFLWGQAHRDHRRAIRRYNAAKPGTAEWENAYRATWEPFNRTFDHLPAAFIMTCVYGLLLFAFVATIRQ